MVKAKAIDVNIVPNKLICNNSLYNISLNSDKYFIKRVIILINENNIISKIMILDGDGIHPNCDPETKEFCLPDSIKCMELNDNTLEIIENTIKIFNFDSAFFQPWNDFNIKE
jgi:hypothetical protein